MLDLANAVQTRLRRHELENRVHHQRTAHLRLKSRSFKPLPNHNIGSTLNRRLNIEEAWRASDLLHFGVLKRRLDDHIDQLLRGGVPLIVKLILQVD